MIAFLIGLAFGAVLGIGVAPRVYELHAEYIMAKYGGEK